MQYYSNKEQQYFSNIRYELIDLIPKNSNNRVLELGAAGGDSLLKIKELGLAGEVVGVELCELPNSNQKNSSIDNFFIGNIESTSITFNDNYFDVIICGDILEHLIDPWEMVRKIQTWLKPGGTFILSIPNIRELKVMYKIFFKGDFGYEKDGILDKTHLRFFCKRNLIALITDAGLNIKIITSTDFYKRSKFWKKRWLNFLTFGLFKDFLITQYIIVSQKS